MIMIIIGAVEDTQMVAMPTALHLHLPSQPSGTRLTIGRAFGTVYQGICGVTRKQRASLAAQDAVDLGYS